MKKISDLKTYIKNIKINKEHIVISLSIIGVLMMLLSYKSFMNRKIELDEVSLRHLDKGMFAIMLEQNDGTYSQSESSTWPTSGYHYNEIKSGCINDSKEEVANILTYDDSTNKVSVRTKSSVYCYLYFDKLYAPSSPTITASDGIASGETHESEFSLTFSGSTISQESGEVVYYYGTSENDITNIGNTIASISENEIYYVKACNTLDTTLCSSTVAYEVVMNVGMSGLDLINSQPDNLNTTLEGGLYRYQGHYETVDNNYICFGTNDTETCTSDTDKYMYRIIGITEDGSIKLIKKEALNTAYAWHSSATADIQWASSALYSNLNGSYFLTNTLYVPADWSDYIDSVNWKYGTGTAHSTPLEWYNATEAFTTSVNAKIGIIYPYDYGYAYQSGGLNCLSSGSPTTCTESWIHISKNDTSPPKSYEWALEDRGYRSGTSYNYYWALRIRESGVGYMAGLKYTTTSSVRPVFYLNSNLKLEDGDGTITNPYIIGLKKYSITISDSNYSLSKTSAAEGDSVSISRSGYSVTSFKLNGETIIGNTFTMLNTNVTITDIISIPFNAPSIGNFVTLDNQSGIYYRVLYNTSGSTYMVLRMNNDLGKKVFNSAESNVYSGSTLDTYMNETYYNTLSSNIKSAIVDNNITQKWYKYYGTPQTAGDTTYTYQHEYEFSGKYWNANLESTTNVGSRHVYALDMEDIYLYLSALKGSSQRVITSTELMNMFFNTSDNTTLSQYIWLRSSNPDSAGAAWGIIGFQASIGMTGNYCLVTITQEIRPAFFIDLSKVDFTVVNPSTISCSSLGNSGC